jgi:hypothetical protein
MATVDVVKIPLVPLEPCPECRRLLPTPLYGGYQHCDGCSIGEHEKFRDPKKGRE